MGAANWSIRRFVSGLLGSSKKTRRGWPAKPPRALQAAHYTAGMDPDQRVAPTMDLAQAATALGVSESTVRAWARRGLIDVVREQPMILAVGSVVDLGHDLERLRETAGSEQRWQSLLAAAADQRELAEPGAREGLAQALAGNTEPLTF